MFTRSLGNDSINSWPAFGYFLTRWNSPAAPQYAARPVCVGCEGWGGLFSGAMTARRPPRGVVTLTPATTAITPPSLPLSLPPQHKYQLFLCSSNPVPTPAMHFSVNTVPVFFSFFISHEFHVLLPSSSETSTESCPLFVIARVRVRARVFMFVCACVRVCAVRA